MDNKVLKLKEGVTFSKFDDDGQDDMYLIKYQERYWKISVIIYQILLGINGERDFSNLHIHLLEEKQIRINQEQLEQVIDFVCVKNGLLEGTESQSKRKRNKMLWGRITIIPQIFVEKLKIFKFLFFPKVISLTSICVVLWIIYIYLTNSNVMIVNELMSLRFSDVVLCYVFIMIAGIIHEFGHSIATLTNGGEAGKIGVGVYILMPVLYSDVTDAWRLKKNQRILVDFGGMYLQGIFLIICFFINMFFLDNFIIHIAILLSGFQILGNLNPFIKLDGYWVLVDYLGEIEILTVVKKVWMDTLVKLRKKNIKYSGISKNKRIVVYVYSIFTILFYLYFARFFLNTIILAINNFYYDIDFLTHNGVTNVNITLEGLFQYLSNRITSFIVFVFLVRIIWMIAKWFYKNFENNKLVHQK